METIFFILTGFKNEFSPHLKHPCVRFTKVISFNLKEEYKTIVTKKTIFAYT